MKITPNIQQTFEPLIRQFCEATKPIDMNENFSSLFLPHTMPNYETAARKIFYFGRDTFGWTPTSKLMQSHENNSHTNYLEETSQWIKEFGFLDYNNNQSSSFWTLAMRLHLRLKGFTRNLKISKDLPKEYLEHINDFGWGNTNAIEIQKSLENQEVWQSLDKEKYWAVKEKSKPLDKVVHTIQAYKPDLVFIFNWDCDKTLFLEGLNYTEKKYDFVKNHFQTYYLPDTDTTIVWTLHPTAARWQGYGTDEMIDEIIGYLNFHKDL